MKYGNLTLGQMEAIVNKLGGMEGVRRFLAGESVVKDVEHRLKVWKTIKIGLHESPHEYLESLDGTVKRLISSSTERIIYNIPISQKEVELDLVLMTGRRLGFKNSERRDVIYARGLGLGLQKCPAEVGPALREQYPDQPKGECVLIVMEPIDCSEGDLYKFNLVSQKKRDLCEFNLGHHASGLFLNHHLSSPGTLYSPSCKWIFVLPRK